MDDFYRESINIQDIEMQFFFYLQKKNN